MSSLFRYAGLVMAARDSIKLAKRQEPVKVPTMMIDALSKLYVLARATCLAVNWSNLLVESCFVTAIDTKRSPTLPTTAAYPMDMIAAAKRLMSKSHHIARNLFMLVLFFALSREHQM